MNEPVRRRLAVPSPSPISDEAISEVAARNGFPVAAPPAAPVAHITPVSPVAASVSRRQRQPTGREHQFNVRLRQDTLDFIYGQANERNIPIAQVIEEMVETFRRSRA